MISVLEAQRIIFEHVRPLQTEEVALIDSLGRFLASPVLAPIDFPPFDNSAMDGFAILSADTKGASLLQAASLKVIKTIAAGDESGIGIKSGEAARIMTGAPIPDGADAVIPFEEIVQEDERTGSPVRISRPVDAGKNLRRAGEDFHRGEKILETGERVTSRTAALVAAAGLDRLTVLKKPRVSIVVTGNELVSPGLRLTPGKIFNSNGPALVAALREMGIEPADVVTAADTEADLRQTLKQGQKGDVLITVGGVSAGDYDLVPKVLRDLDARIIFHKVAVKPGKPLLFAISERTLVFSLPGNPVSSLVVFDHFVRPALLKMMGAVTILREQREAVCDEPLKGSKRTDLLRGVLSYRNGAYHVRSAGAQGSAHLKSLACANCLIVLPQEVTEVETGTQVRVEVL